MRQKFDIGDLIEVSYSSSGGRRNGHGIVLETQIINNYLLDERSVWHVDEYTCKIKFMSAEDTGPHWVRAKWLKHVSKIGEAPERGQK